MLLLYVFLMFLDILNQFCFVSQGTFLFGVNIQSLYKLQTMMEILLCVFLIFMFKVSFVLYFQEIRSRFIIKYNFFSQLHFTLTLQLLKCLSSLFQMINVQLQTSLLMWKCSSVLLVFMKTTNSVGLLVSITQPHQYQAH